MTGLPEGWAESTLGDFIATIRTGPFGSSVHKTDYIEGGRPLINPMHINGGKIVPSPNVTVSDGKARQLSEFAMKSGDIIIGRRGEMGRCAVITSEQEGWLIGTGSMAIKTVDGLLPDFLQRFLSSPIAVATLTDRSIGSTMVNLNQSILSNLELTVPPLLEQRRILAKVDGLTARTARARKELNRIPTLIARHKQRLLALAFSGELIGRSFDGLQISLSGVVLKLDQGWSPKCENFASEDPSVWGVIKTTAIQPVEFLQNENKQLPAHFQPRPKIEISAGEVLITRAGPRNRVGIACYVRSTRPRLMLADKVYRLAIDMAKADPLFVTYMLNAPEALSDIEAMKSGGSESGLNLTQDKFLSLAIPVPSLEEQAEIVRRIESAFGWLDRMAADHAAAARLIPKLDAAILSKAFRGELVPQDPNDEPASVLLERIKAEREAEGKKPKSGRGRPKLPKLEKIDEMTRWSNDGGARIEDTARRTKGGQSMTKSRQDDDVKGKAYLAGLIKSARRSDVQTLFRAADLPVADFYKQLAWEIGEGHILDNPEELKAA